MRALPLAGTDAEFSNSQGCIDDAGRRHGSGRSQHPRCHGTVTLRVIGEKNFRSFTLLYTSILSIDTLLRRERKLDRSPPFPLLFFYSHFLFPPFSL